jgi:transcriptional regulator GlxA family with amidase domain
MAALLLPFGALAAEDKEVDKNKKYRLGVVVFEGFELLDAMGPLEMFGNVGPQLEIVLVAEKAGPVASAQKVKTVADYSFEDCPDLDIVLVPGGFGYTNMVNNEKAMKWLKDRAAKAELVTSVCNGSQILAAGGILDGAKATTNKAYYKMITGMAKDVDWVHEARWVDDGRIITSSGVSAGIDMSLHVIQRLFGEETAMNIAKMTEYEWHRDSTWDPFAKMHAEK